MKYSVKGVWVLLMLSVVFSCGPKTEPQPALPSYLRIPANLEGYAGSGLITVDAFNIRAEGPEQLNTATNTYSGVLGSIVFDNVSANFTAGQPLGFGQSSQVPNEYKANGVLSVVGTRAVGTYPMNPLAPTPRGEFAGLTLNLPGPQLHIAREGSLTITESTLIKTEGGQSLYRIQGTFQTTFTSSGVGVNPNQPISSSGSFDLLLVQS